MNYFQQVEPNSFSNITQLQAIRLDGNQLQNVEGLFKNLPNLVWLNMSDNLLSSFDYNDVPRSLQWLDIHSNRITHLESIAQSEESLTIVTFDVSSNRLTEINDTSIPNTVQQLYLNDNQIHKILPYTFFKKSKLTRVDLYGNKLTTIDPNAFRLTPITDTPEFYIGGNPLECDCNLSWIKKVTSESKTQPQLKDLEHVNCRLSYARGRTHLPLIEAKTNDFLCKYTSHCFPLCHCCDFYACDCNMQCPSGCSCYHDQSWTTNVVDCSSNYNQELPKYIPMDATQLYLDGNNFKEISSHAFIGRKRLNILHLNHSHIDTIKNRTFYGLLELEVLELSHNALDKLYGSEFHGLDNLKELYLQHNKITSIDNLSFANLHQLKVLRLDHNLIVDFAIWSFLPSYMINLQISGNPWRCDCVFNYRMAEYLARHEFIKDREMLKCDTTICSSSTVASNFTTPSVVIGGSDKPPPITGDQLTKLLLKPHVIQESNEILIGLTCCFLFVVFVLILVFIFRQEVRIYCHSRFNVRLCSASDQDLDKNERDKPFDAFVSFSCMDEPFIMEQLLPALEDYRICVYHRDADCPDSIVHAIDTSRRTILVLSQNFIKTEWCRFEFKSAHHQVLRDRRKRLIIILLGEISFKNLDPELQLYLKTNTCLEWGQKFFWKHLRFALPDVSRPAINNFNNQHVMHFNRIGQDVNVVGQSDVSEQQLQMQHFVRSEGFLHGSMRQSQHQNIFPT